MTRYRIVHTTEYRFSQSAWHCRLAAKFKPRQTDRQQVDHFQIVTRPLAEQQPNGPDAFGNCLTNITVDEEFQRLLISANSMVTVVNTPKEKAGADQKNSNHHLYLQPTTLVPLSPEINAFGRSLADTKPHPYDVAQKITCQLFDHFVYHPSATDVKTSADQVLHRRRGVCQDFAHLSIAALRSVGIPARYVSGYVHTAAFRGKAHRIAADASHAWFEVHDPDHGWVGFDPTNGRQVDAHYIVVARGRDYNDVCLLKGTFEGGGEHALHVSVDVQRLDAPAV